MKSVQHVTVRRLQIGPIRAVTVVHSEQTAHLQIAHTSAMKLLIMSQTKGRTGRATRLTFN